MSKVITVVWAAPLAGRWGVKHDGAWVVEPTLGQTVARLRAEAYAEEMRAKAEYAFVNVKTEPMKKKRRWG